MERRDYEEMVYTELGLEEYKEEGVQVGLAWDKAMYCLVTKLVLSQG